MLDRVVPHHIFQLAKKGYPMPKLTVYFPASTEITTESLILVKTALQSIVAEAASTDSVSLSESDVDVLMTPYDPVLCSFSQAVAIEIETFGYANRKAKMTKVAVLDLKRELTSLLIRVGFMVDRTKPLVWLKYVDPEGHHV